ncbi:alpha-1,2-fucosyltransferase [Dysgonomonas macrotermitis]|uniref:Glycosyl transferase family 11 n=1 Tax=Dysgonomonas macrotermitis TaxID=1346286 RepID=A0A1M5I8U5_9BACT|nr:alpha-1,2-fucosyltransferase [Dysgonomonas macrotermitis]SHG24213.1 Glycosyl transferase family 11 [Dysgonomonas macrotermitis]
MITVILSGGLGNQMFQYAASRALSLKKQTGLSIDTFLLRKKTKTTIRSFGLDVFDIKTEEKGSLKTKIITKGFSFYNKYNLNRFIFKVFNVFRDQKTIIYDNRFEKISKNSTLFGYFQNEKYFKAFSDVLRNDFEFIVPIDEKNSKIIEEMASKESISVHIRRGDYLNPNVNLALLDISYYQKAIAYIAEKRENPHFYIFSDDMNWVKGNLELQNINHTFIDWNEGEDSFRDMQLMSLCSHNIIANSSFSWWGAWLNKNRDKIVIAPSIWYKADKNNNPPEGFIPEGWTIL